MEQPPKDKAWSFHLAYFLLALIGVLILQQMWTVYRQTEVVPYSEFQTLLRDSKIASVESAPT